eukprot:GHVN01030263.1.p1 GENE.GHVN01030263.1~~GHVN01030263.1.p1  ORF type:complete len:335 (-),score=50.79 GHVN01030263.1:257-1261(-)
MQAQFSTKELRELLHLDGVLTIIDPADIEASMTEASHVELSMSRVKQRLYPIMQEMAANWEHRHTAKRVLWLRFLLSPEMYLPDEEDATRVGALRCSRNRLVGPAQSQYTEPAFSQEPCSRAPAPSTWNQIEDIKCLLAVSCVGYRIKALKGVPMAPVKASRLGRGFALTYGGKIAFKQSERDEEGDVPDVCSVENERASDVYVTGWAHRGANGVIATNIFDAHATALNMVKNMVVKFRALRNSSTKQNLVKRENQVSHVTSSECLKNNKVGSVRRPGWDPLMDILETGGYQYVTFDQLRNILDKEKQNGYDCGRERVRFPSVEQMLAAKDDPV